MLDINEILKEYMLLSKTSFEKLLISLKQSLYKKLENFLYKTIVILTFIFSCFFNSKEYKTLLFYFLFVSFF